MPTQQLVRVVALRKGGLRPVEFRLRPGERGLSLFRLSGTPSADAIVDAVRSMGKQGELAAVALDADAIQSLGLVLVSTPGGTRFDQVNALQVEARLPFLQRVLLFLRGIRSYDYFNERFSARLCAMARLTD